MTKPLTTNSMKRKKLLHHFLIAALLTLFTSLTISRPVSAQIDTISTWKALPPRNTTSVAWGDVDGDGDLDLAVGQADPEDETGSRNLIYLNEDGVLSLIPVWHSLEADETSSVAWGDVDGDGDLDLAVGNARLSADLPDNPGELPTDIEFGGAQNRVYLNQGGMLDTKAAWNSTDEDFTISMAWGDVDGDGDLDLAVGNGDLPDGVSNRVYLNEGGQLSTTAAWQSDEKDISASVAWGDVDGDGDLDLAVGNYGQNRIYLNAGGQLSTTAAWQSDEEDFTTSVAWGDVDGDGDLDLAVGNGGNFDNLFSVLLGILAGDLQIDGARNRVYLNEGGQLSTTAAWQSDEEDFTISVAWGDVDSDGDLDLAVGNERRNRIYLNGGEALSTTAEWLSGEEEDDITSAVALGDVDGDGDLDLAAGNLDAPSRVYLNKGSTLSPTATQESAESAHTVIVAWGDVDGDGDLDLAVGNGNILNNEQIDNKRNQVYLNEKGEFSAAAAWQSDEDDLTTSLAWGDVDGDGDLDLAVGNRSAPNRIYLNEGEQLSTTAAWQSVEQDETWSVAWGDMDGDGDLDLAVGNGGLIDGASNRVYLNEGGQLSTSAAWQSDAKDRTFSVAWGDVDGDGDFDLAVGNDGQPSQVYLNEGGQLATRSAWQSVERDDTFSVAWGDVDGDGDLDLAVGNDVRNRVYQNEGGRLSTTASWSADQVEKTVSVAWGDVDGDGDLDLAVGNWATPNRVYLNKKGQLSVTAAWQSNGADLTNSVAWGDVDGDGDLDLAIGNVGVPNQVYINRVQRPQAILAGSQTAAVVIQSSPKFNLPSIQQGIIPITFTLYHDGRTEAITAGPPIQVASLPAQQVAAYLPIFAKSGGQAVQYARLSLSSAGLHSTSTGNQVQSVPTSNTQLSGRIKAYYSLNGGGHWQPAVLTADSEVNGLDQSAYPTVTVSNTHVIRWDTFKSGFYGKSDNVVFRIEVYPNASPYNDTPLFQRPYVSAQTRPFRVHGTRIRVMTDTVVAGKEVSKALPNALIYRLPAQQTQGAELISAANGEPIRTNYQGFLDDLGQLDLGDQLMAMIPITVTRSYTVYHTSAPPTTAGLMMDTVNASGVQTLTVSPENTLTLFNLRVSLEWDARKETTFLATLQNDLRKTSAYLFDWTNGQATLGDIHIYHDKGHWGNADIVIQANNSQRPAAIIGGVVITPTHDIGVSDKPIQNAFIPGQVRIGPTWSAFDQPGSSRGDDWPLVLAHELGHYLLHLPDNYLGVTDDGLFTVIDCQGSAMTDPYRDIYSEFLTRDKWIGDCEISVAERYLGRTDWETISRFYPSIQWRGENEGPGNLPLALPKIQSFEPVTPTQTLVDTRFNFIDSDGNAASVKSEQSQVYLFKTRRNGSGPTGRYVVEQGSANGDAINIVRGVEPGDRLCVYDFGSEPLRFGCLGKIGRAPQPIMLHSIPNWGPQIDVTSISTSTVAVTVTNVVTETNLMVQLLPASGAASPEEPMALTNADIFTKEVTAEDGAYYGYIRVWVPDSEPLREMMIAYTAIDNWGGGSYAWGSDTYDFGSANEWGGGSYAWGGGSYAWGGGSYAWGTPMMSHDGQVSVFPLDSIFGSGSNFSLQGMAHLPSLDSWLTPVGQAYRVKATGEMPRASILYRYLGKNVPAGQEPGLQIYYTPREGEPWQRLDTTLKLEQNYASTQTVGEGIYVLIATAELPPFGKGWNQFGYSLESTRTVTTALASIAGKYTSVYAQSSQSVTAGQLYDATVDAQFRPLVNTLTHLEQNRSYSIYATEPITAYLPVGAAARRSHAVEQNVWSQILWSPDVDEQRLQGQNLLLPATFYGWVSPTSTFTPTEGMKITAEMDGVVCGEAEIVPWKGQLAYMMQVPSGGGLNNFAKCIGEGELITFRIGQWLLDHNHQWVNNQAWLHSLDRIADPNLSLTDQRIYLPAVSNP